MAFEFFERAQEKKYDKFNDIGQNIYLLLKFLKYNIPNNKIVFILAHTVVDVNFKKMKTIGKMLDEKLTIEGLFTVTLGTAVTRDMVNKQMTYQFVTRNSGEDTVKTPEDMFEDWFIENDLELVRKTVKEFYNF